MKNLTPSIEALATFLVDVALGIAKVGFSIFFLSVGLLGTSYLARLADWGIETMSPSAAAALVLVSVIALYAIWWAVISLLKLVYRTPR